MNTVLDTWKRATSNAARARVGAQPAVEGSEKSPPVSQAALSLARQIFSSGNAVKRRRVLFVAAEPETKVLQVAETIARAVAAMQANVALVDSRSSQLDQKVFKKPAGSVRITDSWSSFQISERLWKVPFTAFLEIDNPDARNPGDFSPPFDSVVFASVICDSSTPLFCGLCDAAVLLLAAGQTRRDVALRAKQILQQFDVELIGTVLTDRTFPIPESIYRRL